MNKFKSRKFILAVAGALLVIVNSVLEVRGVKPLDANAILSVVGLLAAYIAGESYVDGQRKPE